MLKSFITAQIQGINKMRENSYRKKAFIVILSIAISGLQAQLIDNDLNVYIGFEAGSFPGDKLVSEGAYAAPSFFTNYMANGGFVLKGLKPVTRFLSAGITIGANQAVNWKYEGSAGFENATCQQAYICPVIRVHTNSAYSGRFNNLQFSIELAPLVGTCITRMTTAPYTIVKNGVDISTVLNSQDIVFLQPGNSETKYELNHVSQNRFGGISGTAGLEVELNHRIGTFINYKVSYARISSLFFSDQAFLSSMIQTGILLKLGLDKRYMYNYN